MLVVMVVVCVQRSAHADGRAAARAARAAVCDGWVRSSGIRGGACLHGWILCA